MIRGDDLAQILGIEARRKLGRADQIAEHHRQLPALGSWYGRRSLCCSIGYAVRCGDRLEQLASMAPEHHAEIPEILRRELGQRLPIDLVVAEGGFVSLETQAPQPHCYVH